MTLSNNICHPNSKYFKTMREVTKSSKLKCKVPFKAVNKDLINAEEKNKTLSL